MAELIEAGDAALATLLLRQHFDRYGKEPSELQARTLLKRLALCFVTVNGWRMIQPLLRLRGNALNSRCRDTCTQLCHRRPSGQSWSATACPSCMAIIRLRGAMQSPTRCTSSCASSARSVSVATRGVA